MGVDINNVQITQTDVHNDVATVIVTFELGGPERPVVQIYAEPVSVAPATLVATVDTSGQFNEQQFQNLNPIYLAAGQWFWIWLCPREKSDENDPSTNETNLSDQTDGEYWEKACVGQQFVTQAVEGATGRPPPVITKVFPNSANLHGPANIIVEWGAARGYDKFLIWWTQNGVPQPQGEVDSGGTSGSWKAEPVLPGSHYSFSVKGGTWGGILGNYNYSDWGPGVDVIGPPKLTSVRSLLQASGIDPDYKRVGETMASTLAWETRAADPLSLRKLMGL